MKILFSLFPLLCLVACATTNLPPKDEYSVTLSSADIIKPLLSNDNLLNLRAELEKAYSGSDQVSVLPLGDEIKVTYSSDLLFGIKGSVLLPESQAVLYPFIHACQSYPQSFVRVDAFTDSSGSADKNRLYSQERAQSLAQYFVAQGVSSEQITFKGYGGDFPIVSNESNDLRSLNRRIVLTISKIPFPSPPSAE